MIHQPAIPDAFSSMDTQPVHLIKSQRYINSDVIREWLVLLALSNSKMSLPTDHQQGLAHAFEKACEGVHTGQIQLDYHPFDRNTLDIPTVTHPYYMQALLYWSVQLHCNLNVLADMHATLGNSPSLEKARSAARQIEREALITKTWKNSAKRRRSGGETVPMFQKTDTFLH